ncbi:MAG: ATP-binding protein [Clostridium sp.]
MDSFNNDISSRDLLIQTNDKGIITFVSTNCYEILGFTQNELLSTYVDSLLEYSFENLLLYTTLESSILRKDGQKLLFDIASNHLINDDSVIIGLHLSLFNIKKTKIIEEDNFIKIFERSKDIVFKFQVIPISKFIYITPSINDILGYSSEAHYLNPSLMHELIHPDDVKIQNSKFDKNSDFSKTFCSRFKHKNGHYIWIEDYLIPTYDENGDLTHIAGISRDITERKRMEKKLEEQNKKLEAIIENISDGISIVDKRGNHTLLNKSARDIFMPSCKNISNSDIGYLQYELCGEKSSAEDVAVLRVIKGEKFKDMRTIVKLTNDVLQIDVSGTPIYDNEGNFSFGVLCSRDMTVYFKQENVLKNANIFLDRLIDNIELPVIRLSCPDLKILEINQKAINMVKLFKPNVETTTQIKGKKPEDIFTHFIESEYSEKINEVIKEKKIKYITNKVNMVNGNAIYSNFIFEPVFEQNGEIKEILVLIIDVTPEIKSNIIMEKTLKSQGELLVNISHELKTPLNVIFSTAQLLDMYCKNGSIEKKKDSFIKYIDSIKLNSYRLSKLINNIVDSSKIEEGFFEIHLSNNNIVEVVEEIIMSVTHFTEIKGLNIIFDTNMEEKIMACDPEKIERILLNLISNAIKFSNKGDEIFVEVRDKNEFVEISVKDNGIGIKEKYLDMIFDRFKQVDKSLSRNAEGTGIGLSLVKSIVELHGGSISVESESGNGSKFIVVLPAIEVIQQNILFNNNMRDINENIQVELSDVYS